MKRLKGVQINETHRKTTRVELNPGALRELILDALKRKGLDTNGHVVLHYWTHGFDATSSGIQAGPSISVTVEQNIAAA